MAQVHDIDGTTLSYITGATWDRPPSGAMALDRIQPHNRHWRHVWTANIMAMSEWITLIGKRGALVSITTTDPADPNGDYVTYYAVEVREVRKEAHDSLNARGVTVEFLVKV